MHRPARTPGTIVVALGGNALQPPGRRITIAEQFHHTRESLTAVVELARAGWRIAIVHGNGPQVGDALTRNELARGRVEPLPLGVLVAATAGWIGYMVQQSLVNALRGAGIDREVLTIVTQSVVDREEVAAMRPTKPIGNVLDEADAAALRTRGVTVARDGQGGWRRLAPSPRPIDLVEWPAVDRLVRDGKIVIAGGGGGSPVFWEPGRGWEGVDGVVDKDRVAGIMAARLGADVLLILTQVDAVYRGWGTPQAALVERLGLADAAALLAAEDLGVGSMRPKVEAAVEFVHATGGRAVIAHLARGVAALRGETGTTIVNDDAGATQ